MKKGSKIVACVLTSTLALSEVIPATSVNASNDLSKPIANKVTQNEMMSIPVEIKFEGEHSEIVNMEVNKNEYMLQTSLLNLQQPFYNYPASRRHSNGTVTHSSARMKERINNATSARGMTVTLTRNPGGYPAASVTFAKR